MWLKALFQWLDWRKQISEEYRAEEHHARQSCHEVELRKAQITSWYLPPL